MIYLLSREFSRDFLIPHGICAMSIDVQCIIITQVTPSVYRSGVMYSGR